MYQGVLVGWAESYAYRVVEGFDEGCWEVNKWVVDGFTFSTSAAIWVLREE
jgi:hypothetical protein